MRYVDVKSLIVAVLVTSPPLVETPRLELETPVDKAPPLVEKAIEVELRNGAALVESAILELGPVPTRVKVELSDDEVEFENGTLEASPLFVEKAGLVLKIKVGLVRIVDKNPPVAVELRKGELDTSPPLVEKMPVEIGMEMDDVTSPPFVKSPVPAAEGLLVEFKIGNGALVDEGVELVKASLPFIDTLVPVTKKLFVLVEFKIGSGVLEDGRRTKLEPEPKREDKTPVLIPENGGMETVEVLFVGIGEGAEDVMMPTSLVIGASETELDGR